jgi:hypothetical protein
MFIKTTQEKIMKSLFALLTCAGIALTTAGCPQETTDTTPAPDTTPDLGEPTTLDNTGSTTGAPDTGSSTGASDTGATGDTSDTGTEGAGTEGPALPEAGGTEP